MRVRWDPKRGTPGFFISDPVRGQRLAPGTTGWFAGVPVHINALGFRDPREYTLEKPPGTFRILVLGDSVTFGHGAIDEATYPYLLEQRLKAWRPEVDWQVWNLGVPGYNTGQELAYLLEVGPRYQPDLVVVGFYENDFTNNETPSAPSRADAGPQRGPARRAAEPVFVRVLQARVSDGALAPARQRLRSRTARASRDRGGAARSGAIADRLRWQQLSDVDYFDDQAVRSFECIGVGDQPGLQRARPVAPLVRLGRVARGGPRPAAPASRRRVPGRCSSSTWRRPPVPAHDRFYDGQGALRFSDDLLRILGDGTPVVSTTRAFLHYRPSQMPGAGGHSIGNANRVKADVLFEFLRDRVLPSRTSQAPDMCGICGELSFDAGAPRQPRRRSPP